MSDTVLARADECGLQRRDAWRRRVTLGLVAGGMFMAVLDTTIVNVALPALRASLGATVSSLAWIVDAYTLTFAALILAGGVASDRFGAKTVYLAGLAAFVAASAACGLAPSVGALVAARFAQGAGAALFLPASLAIVRATFDDAQERARAIATWALVASAAAAIGPVLGGLLVDSFGWRSAFLVNLPTGAVAFAGALVSVRQAPRSTSVRRFDWGGQFSSAAALGALCFAAIELPTRGPRSPEVVVASLLFAACVAALIFFERRSREPMVPLAWFRNRIFLAMNAAGTLVYVGYFGLLFNLSLYLHGALGMNAKATGFALLPMAASLSFGNLLSGKLHARLGAARLMTIGLAAAAVSAPLTAALFSWAAPRPFIYASMAVFGAGTALSVPPMIATVLEQVPAELAGVASGLLNALRQAGSLIGVALAGAVTMLAAHLSVSLYVVSAVGGAAYAAAAMLAHAFGAERGTH